MATTNFTWGSSSVCKSTCPQSMATCGQAQMHSEQLRRRQVHTVEQTETAAEDEEGDEETDAARTCLTPKYTDMKEGGRKRKSSCLWSGRVLLVPLAVWWDGKWRLAHLLLQVSLSSRRICCYSCLDDWTDNKSLGFACKTQPHQSRWQSLHLDIDNEKGRRTSWSHNLCLPKGA